MTSDTYVDFAALKERIPIEDVLAHYELTDRLRPKAGHKLVGPCPLCESTHETAFQADTERIVGTAFRRSVAAACSTSWPAAKGSASARRGAPVPEWFEVGEAAVSSLSEASLVES